MSKVATELLSNLDDKIELQIIASEIQERIDALSRALIDVRLGRNYGLQARRVSLSLESALKKFRLRSIEMEKQRREKFGGNR
jgi:hypothetical protein